MVKHGNKFKKIAKNCKISEITKYGEKILQSKKMPKTGQKMSKLKKNVILFQARNYLKKLYSGLKQLKIDLNALK